MEIFIQYGFVVIFVTGFLLTPFFSMWYNIIKRRVDASKLINKRPVPKKVAGLGAWLNILKWVTYLGVITKVAVFGYLSAAVPL